MDDAAVSSATEELRATRARWSPPARWNASRTAAWPARSAPPSTALQNTVVSTTPGRVASPAVAARASAAALPPVSAGASAASSSSSTMNGRSASTSRGALPTCASVIPRCSSSVHRLLAGPFRLGLLYGKDDLESSIPRRRLQSDLAAMAADDDLPRDVQAQAGPFPDLLGGEERLEDAGPDLVGHPGTGVPDLDHDAIVLDGGGSHRELAVPAHRVGRIVDEVRPDLVQLSGKSRDPRQAAVVVTDDLDVVAELVTEHRQRGIEPFVHVERLERGSVHLRVLLGRGEKPGDAPGGIRVLVEHAVGFQGTDGIGQPDLQVRRRQHLRKALEPIQVDTGCDQRRRDVP